MAKLIIISGLSGSGKTIALNTLEDFGYYCIDNLPICLLQEFSKQIIEGSPRIYQKSAVGIDARNLPEEVSRFPKILEQLKQNSLQCEIIFLQSDTNVLLKRYSETRRKHPLSNNITPLEEAIELESQRLDPLLQEADLVINTTHSNVHQLRQLIREQVIKRAPEQLSLLFQSFGFKHGVPNDADFVFDVRYLPNPYWQLELRQLTGQDQATIDFLEQQAQVTEALTELKTFLSQWITRFRQNNRSYITIAIGCTGGQHRSVYICEQLQRYFKKHYPLVLVRHRELS